VSLLDGPDACAGGGYSNVNITVLGTSLCNFTKVLGLSSPDYGNVYGDMINDDTYYITNGTDYREIKRDGSAQTGTAQTSCTSCSNPVTPEPPTPTPIPSTYDVYGRCDDAGVTKYYVYYDSNNLQQITINGACCFRLSQNVDNAYIIDNYSPSPTFFLAYTNTNCFCN
jgi:hypothetical protein